jgi:XrtJ-associated TM-motif-TM protein
MAGQSSARSFKAVFYTARSQKHFEWGIEDIAKMKRTLFVATFTLMLAAALPLHAQSGCTDSPEDPTVVLALLAGAGAFVASVRAARGRKG